MVGVEPPKIASQNASDTCIQLLLSFVFYITAIVISAFSRPLEIIDREICRASVESGNTMHALHSCCILSTPHEEFRRLVELEDKESNTPENKHEASHSENKVAPALYIRCQMKIVYQLGKPNLVFVV